MNVLVTVLIVLAGWAALALAKPRHARALLGHEPGPALRFWLRLAGALCLGGGVWLCLLLWGWRIGLVAWFGIAGAAGLVLVFLLPYLSRRV